MLASFHSFCVFLFGFQLRFNFSTLTWFILMAPRALKKSNSTLGTHDTHKFASLSCQASHEQCGHKRSVVVKYNFNVVDFEY